MKTLISEFLDRRPLVMKKETSVGEAARAMHESHVGSVVVCSDRGQIIGIVTDRDLSCQVLAFALPAKTKISQIMTTQIVTAAPTDSLEKVVSLMAENGVRRIPVVEETTTGAQRCLGIITVDDLILTGTATVEELKHIVRGQIRRQMRSFQIVGQRRERGHREQTLNKFNKVMATKMDLAKENAEKAAFFLLKKLVQRLSYTNAAHFISQLPGNLQEDLLSLPAGPDRNVSGETILKGLMKMLEVDRPAAAEIVKAFWSGLEVAVNPEIKKYLKAQLPAELKLTFEGNHSSVKSHPPRRTLMAITE